MVGNSVDISWCLHIQAMLFRTEDRFSRLVSAVWGVTKPAQVSYVRLPALKMFRNRTFLKARLIYDLANLTSNIVKHVISH